MRNSIKFLCKIPVFGNLGITESKHHGSALIDVIYSIIFSLLPLWGGAFYYILENSNDKILSKTTYWQWFWKISENGLFFLYAATFVTPILIILINDRGYKKCFPSKPTFLLFSIIILCGSSFVVAWQTGQSTALSNSLYLLSVFVFCFSIVLYYFASVYRNAVILPDPAQKMRIGENEFFDKYEEHYKKKDMGE